jgi:hypothetical protein
MQAHWTAKRGLNEVRKLVLIDVWRRTAINLLRKWAVYCQGGLILPAELGLVWAADGNAHHSFSGVKLGTRE